MFIKLLRYCLALFAPLLAYLLPTTAKRMVVLTSLYGKLTRKRRVPLATLRKLNDTLHLLNGRRHEEALLVPLTLQSLIWGNVEIDLTELKRLVYKDRYIDRIIASIPESLRYGYERSDIMKLLTLIDSY